MHLTAYCALNKKEGTVSHPRFQIKHSIAKSLGNGNRKKVGFTAEDLERFWNEKYKFCRNTLHLSPGRAREWADRAVSAITGVDVKSKP